VGQCVARQLTNLAHCAESAAAHTSGARKARAGSQTASDQGRNVAESGCTSSITEGVIASAREWCCVLDLRLDQKIDGGASGCCTSCMHCGEAQGIPWKLACTACCTARLYNLVWTSFALRTFGLKLNWEAPMG
jgi:hypothetical protein